MEALLWVLRPVRQDVSVNDTHVVNTVCPMLTGVPDKKVALMLRDLWRLNFCMFSGSACPVWRSLCPIHGATWVNEGVVAHVGGGEGFACQVYYPVTELVVMHRDKAALLKANGVNDQELGMEAITVCGEVRGLEDIPQEEGVAPFLVPHICPIDCGRLHCQPGPGICRLSQSTCL